MKECQTLSSLIVIRASVLFRRKVKYNGKWGMHFHCNWWNNGSAIAKIGGRTKFANYCRYIWRKIQRTKAARETWFNGTRKLLKSLEFRGKINGFKFIWFELWEFYNKNVQIHFSLFNYFLKLFQQTFLFSAHNSILIA